MKELRVRDAMTPDPTTLKRYDKLTLADDIMRLGRVRHCLFSMMTVSSSSG
jgi:hypothetical protein